MRTFSAEYISHNNEASYFNVDLGFKKWYIAEIRLVGDVPRLKFGDKVTLDTEMTQSRPAKYTATATKL